MNKRQEEMRRVQECEERKGDRKEAIMLGERSVPDLLQVDVVRE